VRFLDANVILQYLTRDDVGKAAACLALFRRVEAGAEEITTCEAVIAEVAYVLSSRRHYGLTHAEVSARLRPIVAMRGLRLPNKRVYLRALDIYAGQPDFDFEDALIAAHMERGTLTELYSYDTDFDQLPGINRLQPWRASSDGARGGCCCEQRAGSMEFCAARWPGPERVCYTRASRPARRVALDPAGGGRPCLSIPICSAVLSRTGPAASPSSPPATTTSYGA
jgi:predicted nucleic acid-binding protein